MNEKGGQEFSFVKMEFEVPPADREKAAPDNQPEQTKSQEQNKSVTQLANDFLRRHSVDIDAFAATMWTLNAMVQAQLAGLPTTDGVNHAVLAGMSLGAAIFFGGIAMVDQQYKNRQNK